MWTVVKPTRVITDSCFITHECQIRCWQVSARVMDIYKFMNSKVLFKDVRHRQQKAQPATPVMVHINYHPDKHNRMKAVFNYYEGDPHALDKFPGGSELGTK